MRPLLNFSIVKNVDIQKSLESIGTKITIMGSVNYCQLQSNEETNVTNLGEYKSCNPKRPVSTVLPRS